MFVVLGSRGENQTFFSFVAFSWTGAISLFSFRYLSLFTCLFGATGLRGVNQIVSFVVSSWTSAIRFVFF